MALCIICAFAPAWSATFVAAKAARVPHGRAAVVRRRRSLTNGDSGDKATCIHGWLAYAFVRLCRPKAPLRETLLPLLISALDARTPRSARQRARPLRGRRLVGPPSMRRGGVALLSIPVSLEDSANGNVARPSARPPWLANARAFGGQGYFINTTLFQGQVNLPKRRSR